MSDAGGAKLDTARDLMETFAIATGLRGVGGDPARRYLWTDALAVETFFGLSAARDSPTAREDAQRLIEATHETLGRYHVGDARSGWISGLSEEEGRARPTAAGLRIGKAMLERNPDEPMDETLEWERDGQYFHYLTRWASALRLAAELVGEQRFSGWAVDLLKAAQRFIDKQGSGIRLFWKKSVDLSRPLVATQGAHDPLEGLICCETAKQSAPEAGAVLDPLIRDLRRLCENRSWSTVDPLGIGGLLLNLSRATQLTESGIELPAEVRPERLLEDTIDGLERYVQMQASTGLATRRLPFRECGLSLGLRSARGAAESGGAVAEALEGYLPLSSEIEAFWSDAAAQDSPSWTEHQDINAVSLAASLVAAEQPRIFI